MIQEQPRQDSFRWMILFMLFAATTINYLDRQILSILKPILDVELGWTDAQYGMIMSIFQASYAIGLTMFGWIIDKYGARMGFAISIIWWSVGAISHAFAVGVKSMGLSRIILGLGEGGNFPASIKTVTNWFTSGERVFATTLFNSGANVGAWWLRPPSRSSPPLGAGSPRSSRPACWASSGWPSGSGCRRNRA